MLILNTVTQGLKFVGALFFSLDFSGRTYREASFLLAAYINDYLRAMGR
jgi:hypothetical protein